MANYVPVLSSTGKPLMPCHPARARELLDKGKAAVYKRQPFTIILKHRPDGDLNKTSLKIDPGSKTTGMAVTVHGKRGERCVMGIHLEHRGSLIKKRIADRAMYRRNRRSRKTRYRAARYLNRTKPEGWLAPSLIHRVHTTMTWVRRLILATPVSTIEVEYVSFDTQKMLNKDIKGKEYQQGTLQGYKVREYMLIRYNYVCQYCSGVSKDRVLEIDHVIPRSRGGSDMTSNLTLSCHSCNQSKGNRTPTQWELALLGKGDALSAARRKGCRRVAGRIMPSMRDAAAVNSTAKRLFSTIQEIGLLTIERPSYLTKYNRHRHGYKKDHYIDAAVLGGISTQVYIPPGMVPLTVRAMGHGSRHMVNTDKHGFPKGRPKNPSRVNGFKTGDIVRVARTKGICPGIHVGRAVMTNGLVKIVIDGKSVATHVEQCTLLQMGDGYRYVTL